MKKSANIPWKSIVYFNIQTIECENKWAEDFVSLRMSFSHHCFLFMDFSMRCLNERSSFNSNMACLANNPNERNRKRLFENICTCIHVYLLMKIRHIPSGFVAGS